MPVATLPNGRDREVLLGVNWSSPVSHTMALVGHLFTACGVAIALSS